MILQHVFLLHKNCCFF